MDEGMNHPNDPPEAWGEDESRVFVEFGQAVVPGREEIEGTLLDLLPVERNEPFVAVEIGTGAGWLSAAVLREFPEARMVGLDGSPAMLRAAGELLAPHGDRVRLSTRRTGARTPRDGDLPGGDRAPLSRTGSGRRGSETVGFGGVSVWR